MKKKCLFPPLFSSMVSAGFPSPAEDHIEETLDLNKLLVRNKAATFFVKVKGDSMIDANIYSGDILVIDRSITAKNGSIVIAIVDGEFTVKRLKKVRNKIYLQAENDQYPLMNINATMDFSIWGVVTYIIHQPKNS